jgi:transposase InsO family protein
MPRVLALNVAVLHYGMPSIQGVGGPPRHRSLVDALWPHSEARIVLLALCDRRSVAIEQLGLGELASRVGFVKMHADERMGSAVAFLQAAVAHYSALGVRIERLLADNGSAYRSRLFAKTCQALGIKHRFTNPYHPQTNSKAEPSIQTYLREWAYGRTWQHSSQRAAWLQFFLSYYNTRSPHSVLGHRPPASRLCGNNLLRLNN